MTLPTVGRIVLLHLSGDVLPAIVIRANTADATINVVAFSDSMPLTVCKLYRHVPERGTTLGTHQPLVEWCWPPDTRAR